MKKFDMDNKSTKVSVIDCLDCENYYTGACDGRAGGCDAYTPTRKITMADDIASIKRGLNGVMLTLIGMYAILCAVAIAVI